MSANSPLLHKIQHIFSLMSRCGLPRASNTRRAANLFDSKLRVFNFDNQFRISLVVKFNNDGFFGIVHIPKHPAAMLNESSSRYHSRKISADQLDPVPPTTRRIGIMTNTANMPKRNVELPSEGPQFVHSANFHVKLVAGN